MIAFKNLKLEIILKTKSGIDFIISLSIVWFVIFFVWFYFIDESTHDKSIFSIFVSITLFPLTYLFSKIFKTNWNIKKNPLQPLRRLLNFSHLMQLPFLLFCVIYFPDYFIVTYAVITGINLLPFSWYYHNYGYTISAIIISLGSVILSVYSSHIDVFFIPLLIATVLLILGISIYVNNRKLHKRYRR